MAVKPRPATLACTISALAMALRACRAWRARRPWPRTAGRARGGDRLGSSALATAKSHMVAAANPHGDRGRPGDPARRRQRRRCRRCRPAGSQSGRAAVLGARRRRVHPALGCGGQAAQDLRRARDGAGRGHRRPVPGRRPAAQVRRRRVRRPERRRARHAAPCSRPCTAGTAGCRGRACSRRRSGWPRTASASLRACTCCCAGTARTASRRRRAATSSIRPAAPARPATCSRNPEFAATLRAIAERGAEAFYTGADRRGDRARRCARRPTTRATSPLADLAGYRVKEREPVCVAYRALSRLRHGPALLRRLGRRARS